MESTATGRLLLAGTPIGNLADASPALRTAIESADIVAAEDTRRFAALLGRLGWHTNARVVSYFDGNETARASELLTELTDGRSVVVVTDAGMPTVSDPGYRLLTAAIAAGVPIQVVPGPSAVLVALAASGLATDRFCFEGFLPRKAEQRRRRLAELVAEPRTMVFFEAPHRLAAFLADAREAFGESRAAAVCRELTKTWEETRRGSLAELSEAFAEGARGEITVVIAGGQVVALSLADGVGMVLDRLSAGDRLSAAVTAVAQVSGLPRKPLYAAALAARKESP